jgi:hypothetical protein
MEGGDTGFPASGRIPKSTEEYRYELAHWGHALVPAGMRLRIDRVIYREMFEGWYLYAYCTVLSGPLADKTIESLDIISGKDSGGKLVAAAPNWRVVEESGSSEINRKLPGSLLKPQWGHY